MKKIAFQNLGMIVTNSCNLDCAHCMRGKKYNCNMSKEVIDATMDQTIAISNLAICGGEPTLALDTLEYLFESVINHQIYLNEVSCVINGTNYSKDFLSLLKYIKKYIKQYDSKPKVYFNISYDKYHMDEIKRLDLIDDFARSYEEYRQSKYFHRLQGVNDGEIFREGNAINLPKEVTIPLRPMKTYIAVSKKGKKKELYNVGPLVTINPRGIITECDASIVNQVKKYNYGNVLEDSILEVMKEKGKVIKAKKWDMCTTKEIIKYRTYKY